MHISIVLLLGIFCTLICPPYGVGHVVSELVPSGSTLSFGCGPCVEYTATKLCINLGLIISAKVAVRVREYMTLLNICVVTCLWCFWVNDMM